jgi:NAD(P)-dependent dehydrogenase (short-subunit alcohol dehydrogenase family)
MRQCRVVSTGPLAGQTVLVIGGSSGIGLATARRAHAEGARLIVTGRDPQRVQRAGLEVNGSIAGFDATDFDRLGAFLGELPSPLDHVMVSGPGPRDVALFDLDPGGARCVLDAHLVLPLQVARHAASRVRPGGSLIFMGCTDGRRASAGRAFVAAITAALSALTRSLAAELAPTRVNVIAAGFVDTPLAAAAFGERRHRLEAALPIGRVMDPRDVADLAVHLMTNTAVTGATFEVDGGQQAVEL